MKNILVILFILFVSNVHAQSWLTVGNPDFSPDGTGFNSLALDRNGTLIYLT